jgi:5,10-methylenetetrahydromethanopterin reductase
MDELFNRFGTYILPGRISDPRRGIDEARDAERIGLGTVWISERYALKEPAVLCGAVGEVTSRTRISGTFYATLRHPIVTASIANLMQAMTGDRFRTVFARAVPWYLEQIGAPAITFARLADYFSILRRLWAGETVNYEGILGCYPNLSLTDRHEGPSPPIIFTAIGPRALAFAGEHCDGVLLHPFLTPDAVAAAIKTVRDAAERVGRNPGDVRIYHNIIVAPDLPHAEEEAVVGGRAVTYFQAIGFGELLVDINGWDRAELAKLRAHPTLASLGNRTADQAYTRDQLVEASRLLPKSWIEQGAAVGTAEQCARKLLDFIAAGADEIVLHGSAPKDLSGLAAALRIALRPS